MKKPALILVEIYRRIISPVLGTSGRCRFIPTCSEYTYQAIEKYGTIRGSFKGLLRIIRCHPFSKGGLDPLG